MARQGRTPANKLDRLELTGIAISLSDVDKLPVGRRLVPFLDLFPQPAPVFLDHHSAIAIPSKLIGIPEGRITLLATPDVEAIVSVGPAVLSITDFTEHISVVHVSIGKVGGARWGRVAML